MKRAILAILLCASSAFAAQVIGRPSTIARECGYSQLVNNWLGGEGRNCVFAFIPGIGKTRAITGQTLLQYTTLTQDAAGKYVYDPRSGTIKNFPSGAMPVGCPVEPARTNLITYSAQIDQWGNWNTTVTTNTTVAPDGTTTGDTLVAGANASANRSQSFSSTNAAYCGAIWIKAGTAATCEFGLWDNSASTMVARGRWTFSTRTLTTVTGTCGYTEHANGWIRVWCSATIPASGTDYFYIYPGTAGSVVNGETVIYWGGQVELGSYPTSYIPTTTGTVARAKDVVVYPTPSVPNANTCGILDVTQNNYAGGTHMLSLYTYDNISTRQANLRVSGDVRVFTSGGGGSTLASGVTHTANTLFATCSTWTAANNWICVNRSTPATGAWTSYGSFNSIVFDGANASDSNYGYSHFLTCLFNRTLKTTEMQNLTTPRIAEMLKFAK
jgi:hypothetical protein